jgi:prepilin-type N-terminal cleavage/methylation domain-containing protein
MPFTARAAGAQVAPGAKEHRKMTRKLGFTLVELLVVIAIISILAAIVTPRVQGFLLKGRMTKAVAEIENINTALMKVLTDANKDNFRHLFKDPDDDPATHDPVIDPPADADELRSQITAHSQAMYEILRLGKNADVSKYGLVFADGVQSKLGTSYLDLGQDPWNRLYQFWLGPWRGYDDGPPVEPIPFRSYRSHVDEDGDGLYTGADDIWWEYNAARKSEMDAELPGNPPADDLVGFPAPKDMGVYVFSTGVNMRSDQVYNDANIAEEDHKGGGDDINNWDNQQGWQDFYG